MALLKLNTPLKKDLSSQVLEFSYVFIFQIA